LQERRADSTAPVRRAGGVSRGLLLLAVAGAVVAVDQGTKSWAQTALADGERRHVVATLYLVLTYNRGAAFSLGRGAAPLVEAIAIALAVIVLWLSGRLAHAGGNLAALVGLGMVAGGALSNLGDRFIRHNHGAVIDFVQLVSWWPVFNLADAAITVGAVTVAVHLVVSPLVQPPAHVGGTPPLPGAAEPPQSPGASSSGSRAGTGHRS